MILRLLEARDLSSSRVRLSAVDFVFKFLRERVWRMQGWTIFNTVLYGPHSIDGHIYLLFVPSKGSQVSLPIIMPQILA